LNQSALHTNTDLIKQKALEMGFSFCGISKAEFLESEAPRLEKWLKENKHGSMYYMESYFDKRLDPTKLVEGAKSIISLLLNYCPETKQEEALPKISTYAYGEDYHFVMKDKMKDLLQFIQQTIGEVSGRAFVDSAPVMDKVWAQKSGLGWVGKHSNLIVKGNGSFFFIGEIIVDLELRYDSAIGDFCGSCTRCIDACPTEAIESPYVVNGSKCISYFTIELKNEVIPADYKGKFKDWAFGCDICQDVCPWNRFSSPTKEKRFEPNNALLGMNKKDWEEITEEVFKAISKKSPVKRAKLSGMKRNIKFLE
jgi:epoxyqueuosine reductase